MPDGSVLTLPCPAKVNLFLHINGKRPDGYHNIQSLMHFVDFADEIKFTPADKLSLSCDTYELNTENNLILKAAKAMQPFQKQGHGMHFDLHKRIPVSAGLGGGSSNAATTLIGLNQLWDCQLSTEQLLEIATTIGADVPFFVLGRTAFAEGIGEKLTPTDIKLQWYVIVVPHRPISTQMFYQDPQLVRNTPVISLANCDLEQTHNDFTAVARRHAQEVDKTLDWLAQYGKCKMSGTGSAVFIACDSASAAEKIVDCAKSELEACIFMAKGCNVSPLLIAIGA